MMRPYFIHIIILPYILVSLVLSSCTRRDESKSGKLKVITTTSLIKDVVQHVGGGYVEVEALMGPGVDPHLYKASHGDLERLTAADLIIYNGLHLEGKMGEVLQKLGRIKPVVAVTSTIPQSQLREIPGLKDAYDPHIWFDVKLWQHAVEAVSQALQTQDSAHAKVYTENAKTYNRRLDSLHHAVQVSIQQVPPQQRVLITAHDAFGYFGDAYKIEVRGLQGISTVSGFGLRDVTDLVKFIIEKKIKAIFIETSVSQKSIEAVIEGCKQKDWQVKMGGSLYSDALGAQGTAAGTYIGMVNANVMKIVEALK